MAASCLTLHRKLTNLVMVLVQQKSHMGYGHAHGHANKHARGHTHGHAHGDTHGHTVFSRHPYAVTQAKSDATIIFIYIYVYIYIYIYVNICV